MYRKKNMLVPEHSTLVSAEILNTVSSGISVKKKKILGNGLIFVRHCLVSESQLLKLCIFMNKYIA